MKQENEENKDIDKDFVDKNSKKFIIRRIFIFDDVGDQLKNKQSDAFK